MQDNQSGDNNSPGASGYAPGHQMQNNNQTGGTTEGRASATDPSGPSSTGSQSGSGASNLGTGGATGTGGASGSSGSSGSGK